MLYYIKYQKSFIRRNVYNHGINKVHNLMLIILFHNLNFIILSGTSYCKYRCIIRRTYLFFVPFGVSQFCSQNFV